MLIIDAHCHAGKGNLLTEPCFIHAPLKEYLIRAKRAGIQKTVIFPVLNTTYQEANKEISLLVSRFPDFFFGFVFVHPVNDAGNVYHIFQNAVKQSGICGVKVHIHDGAITREICEAAQKLTLPVLYDPMGEVGHIELIAREFKKINFIIPHLSSYSDDWKAQMSFIHMLATLPNVYTDTSGVRNFDILKLAVQKAGTSKIIFGSDGPWLNPEVELFKIRALYLRREQEEQILSGNIIRILQRRGMGV